MSAIEPLPPAIWTVHWATGPVLCCDRHAEQLCGIGRAMGYHTVAIPYAGTEPCSNCVNEQRKK